MVAAARPAFTGLCLMGRHPQCLKGLLLENGERIECGCECHDREDADLTPGQRFMAHTVKASRKLSGS